MKGSEERKLLRELEGLDKAIQERFKAERRPNVTVDGENPWDLDPFEEDEC